MSYAIVDAAFLIESTRASVILLFGESKNIPSEVKSRLITAETRSLPTSKAAAAREKSVVKRMVLGFSIESIVSEVLVFCRDQVKIKIK